MIPLEGRMPVLVACPDSRAPAYQAVIGLHRAKLLGRFYTGFYYREVPSLTTLGRAVVPRAYARAERALKRRYHPEIPSGRVRSFWSYDLAIRVESRLARHGLELKREVVRWRADRFDRAVATAIERERPGAAIVFSDVATRHTLPRCRAMGIPTVLSMVHGDVREEREVLAREAEKSPDFFPLYLGDNSLDQVELNWLHERRLAELEIADTVIVPSDHIADALEVHGTPRTKIRVIPYAADTRRFRPDPAKRPGKDCTFLFAGGVSQRKGIKYLLEAWRLVKRPGWRLQLLGALPRDPGPLAPYFDQVERLGRVPYSEVAACMSAADVFVFPSLFEGSAVVTYEALACGLPSIVTPSAGSIVREGKEGFLVPPGDVPSLAERMIRLGCDPELRESMSRSARLLAEMYDWERYHESIVDTLRSVMPALGVVA